MPVSFEGNLAYARNVRESARTAAAMPTAYVDGSRAQFALVGAFKRQTGLAALEDVNPLGIPTMAEQAREYESSGSVLPTSYNAVSRNCHDHAQGIVSELEQ
jgi:hypothetical protein